MLEVQIRVNICNRVLFYHKQTRLIRVFHLMNTAESISVICRSLVQAHFYGSSFRVLFHRFQTNRQSGDRPDKDSYLSRLELINKCNQLITVPKAKAIQSLLLANKTNKHTKHEEKVKLDKQAHQKRGKT